MMSLHIIISASPATIDLMKAVDDDFATIVEALDASTRIAVTNQDDPDVMTDKERKRVRLALLHQVYGRPFYQFYFLVGSGNFGGLRTVCYI